MSGGFVVADKVAEEMLAYMTAAMPPIYRPFAEVRVPRSRRQRFIGRMRLRVWEWRYRIAQAIYPFAEGDAI